jgi:hypothetical protein
VGGEDNYPGMMMNQFAGLQNLGSPGRKIKHLEKRRYLKCRTSKTLDKEAKARKDTKSEDFA